MTCLCTTMSIFDLSTRSSMPCSTPLYLSFFPVTDMVHIKPMSSQSTQGPHKVTHIPSPPRMWRLKTCIWLRPAWLWRSQWHAKLSETASSMPGWHKGARHQQLRPHVSNDSPPCTPAPLTWHAVMPTMPRADSAFTTFCSRHGRIIACMCMAQSWRAHVTSKTSPHVTMAVRHVCCGASAQQAGDDHQP